jgi:glucosamine--fructose-6-phosphate aminotransferase (isomerizing)
MCGIVGYIGKRQAFPILLSALKRLEYRGYDSYGFCVFNGTQDPFLRKRVGKISDAESELLEMDVKGSVGQAHTRWATTGGVTEENAHPHFDCQKNVFVVHNGIIENYSELKDQLIAEGHKFSSETDTEVLAHLIEKFLKEKNADGKEKKLEEAVADALKEIKGTYGLLVMAKSEPQKLVAARLSSPLLIGVNDDGYIIASDPIAIAPYAQKIVTLDDYEIATITPDKLFLARERAPEVLEYTSEEAEKGDYDHFMLKEIMEEPTTIENAIQGRLMPDVGSVKLGGLENVADRLRELDRLFLIGCGTAHYATLVGKYMLEEYAGIKAETDVGSEFRYRKPILDDKTGAIFISQSGETADTLACLHELKQKGILSLGITNAIGSTQSRETDAGIYTRCGPEIAVASTKAFIGQLATLAMLTVYLGRQRDMALAMGTRIVSELAKMPDLARQVLEQRQNIKKVADKYKGYKNFWYIGRKYNAPIALEGALKLKEISYLHAEGVPGGELKHGPLALVEKSFPTIAICPSDSVYEKMVSNIHEIKARNGLVIAIATEGNEDIKKIVDDVIYIPKTLEMLSPLLTVIPMHLFAYYMAVSMGRDVDRPRNLAKSVTVE